MTQQIPAIYSNAAVVPRLGAGFRIGAALLALACLGALAVAGTLQPSHSGVGTHRGLAMEECQFLARWALPCPTCGVTTSIALLVRGHPLASLYVQPLGTLLAGLTAGLFWAAGYIAATGRPVHRLVRFVPVNGLLIGLLVFAIAAWGWKMVIRQVGIDGW